MEKRGQSEVITTVLIILLVLAAIFIVWNVVRSMIQKQTGEIQPDIFTISLELSKVEVSQFDAQVSVERGSGKGNITSLKFVFKNAAGGTYIYEEKDPQKIPGELETKKVYINFAGNIINVNSISVVPGFGDKLGIETKEEIKESEIVAPNGAVGWWKLESDLKDYAGNNSGTGGSGIYTGSGVNALSFSIAKDNVTINKGNYFSGTAANAISVWVYRTGDGVETMYVIFAQKASDGKGKPQLFLRDTISEPNTAVWGEAGVGDHIKIIGLPELDVNKWINIIISRSANGKAMMYLSGINLKNDTDPNRNYPTGASLGANSYIGVGTNGLEPFKGYIKNLMIFNKSLTQAEITQLYNSQK